MPRPHWKKSPAAWRAVIYCGRNHVSGIDMHQVCTYGISFHITYMKIYTKIGDSGSTYLQEGASVRKSDPRIRTYGALDEANSILGIVLTGEVDPTMRDTLESLQKDIFVLGADISNPNMSNKSLRVASHMTERLEGLIDRADKKLEPLTNFILPGGGATGSYLHHARTVVRRAETHMADIRPANSLNSECLRYVNRLSDLLFVLARVANQNEGISEILWMP